MVWNTETMTNDLLSRLRPALTIDCSGETFFLSKLTWSQFAYFRLLMLGTTQEGDVQIRAHEDFFAFLKFISGQFAAHEDQILLIHNMALDLGMDMDGRIAGQLTIRLYRWATSYGVGKECHNLIEIACEQTFSGISKWPIQGDPFRISNLIRDALIASVLPMDGHPVIDMRNIYTVRKVWTQEINHPRAATVRQHLQRAFDASVTPI